MVDRDPVEILHIAVLLQIINNMHVAYYNYLIIFAFVVVEDKNISSD